MEDELSASQVFARKQERDNRVRFAKKESTASAATASAATAGQTPARCALNLEVCPDSSKRIDTGRAPIITRPVMRMMKAKPEEEDDPAVVDDNRASAVKRKAEAAMAAAVTEKVNILFNSSSIHTGR
jgi:hypothetical protein